LRPATIDWILVCDFDSCVENSKLLLILDREKLSCTTVNRSPAWEILVHAVSDCWQLLVNASQKLYTVSKNIPLAIIVTYTNQLW